MELNRQVCSLEFARKMKDLGVKQDSYAYWWEGGWKDEWCVVPADVFTCDCDSEPEAMHGCDIRKIAAERIGGPGKYDPEAAFSAFTVAELGEMLPWSLYSGTEDAVALYYGCVPRMQFWLQYRNRLKPDNLIPRFGNIEGDGEADARAKCLIYLLENGIIKANDL